MKASSKKSQLYGACLLAAMSLLAGRASSESLAPSYFLDEALIKRDSIPDPRAPSPHVDLRPPRHARHGSWENAVKRSQQRAERRRRVEAASRDRPSSSDVNMNDKVQELGHLGDAYNAPVNMSNPAQLVFVELDTGSADLWVVSSSCNNQQCQAQDLFKFDEKASGTYRQLAVESNVNVNTTSSSTSTASNGTLSNGEQRAARAESEDAQLGDRGDEGSGSVQRRAPSRRPGFGLLRMFAAAPSSSGNAVPFSITYDSTETATGVLGVENITLANLGVSQQIFGLVNSTNITLQEQGISGVLGLGFTRSSAIARSLFNVTEQVQGKSTPLMTSLITSSDVSYPLFSLALNQSGGRLTVGAIDTAYLPDKQARLDVAWYDVVPFPSGNRAAPETSLSNQEARVLGSYAYWALRLTGAGVNGTGVDIRPTYSQVGTDPIALIDSGTLGIVGPFDAVGRLFDQIFGARYVGDGRWVVPCDTTVRMHVSFGPQRNFTLLPSDYLIGPAVGNPYLCLAWPAAVPASPDGVDWILGQAFMRAQYSIFSLGIEGKEPPKIGFYPFRASPSAESSSLYAPEPTASLSSFLSSIATAIATTLPNSIVPLLAPTSTASYIFLNATQTPSLGLLPTLGAGSRSYSALISQVTGNEVPVIANDSRQVIPAPPNPAATGKKDGASRSATLDLQLQLLCVAVVLMTSTVLRMLD
ncbi:Aspartyl protease [Ceraceosorus bombacis]|uniref:Aspartyl protease n=1 Tax=Ceraceosorus bombacis TaxID=401625 RepID=A0A0P1BJ53_9BASI|nr:Aspartyl protease [Ceraceosorus bombacis]